MTEPLPPALAGERLDRAVALLTQTSRSTAAALVAAGAVQVNGRVRTDRAARLSEGDELVVAAAALATERERGRPSAEPDTELAVVHEDRHLVVVDKPAGLVVHPGAGRTAGTLCGALLARYPEMAAVGEATRPGIVHRLDAGTSGLLVAARTSGAYDSLVAQLAGRAVRRRYEAVCWGTVGDDPGGKGAPGGRAGPPPRPPSDPASSPEPQQDPLGFAREILLGVWQRPSEYCEAAYAPYAVLSDSDREVAGASEIFSHYAALRESLKVLRLSVDHAGLQARGGGWTLAARWTAAAEHSREFEELPATRAPLFLMGISHWWLTGGRVAREWTVFDRLALMEQILRHGKTP